MRFVLHDKNDEYICWIELSGVPRKGDFVIDDDDAERKVERVIWDKNLLAGEDLYSAKPATAKLIVK